MIRFRLDLSEATDNEIANLYRLPHVAPIIEEFARPPSEGHIEFSLLIFNGVPMVSASIVFSPGDADVH